MARLATKGMREASSDERPAFVRTRTCQIIRVWPDGGELPCGGRPVEAYGGVCEYHHVTLDGGTYAPATAPAGVEVDDDADASDARRRSVATRLAEGFSLFDED